MTQCGSAAGVRDGEFRSLFNWTARSSTGARKRRKTGSIPKSKKVVVPTWSHTYVCLGHPEDDAVPDSHDQATLKLAGLGERRFPIDVYSTGQEFYDELLFQYPKLREGGGFELLRVPEGGGKELEVIKVPEGGYNTEFLRAVVHSARIFIRPLQKALDLRPQTSEVSYKVELTSHYLVPLSLCTSQCDGLCPSTLNIQCFGRANER